MADPVTVPRRPAPPPWVPPRGWNAVRVVGCLLPVVAFGGFAFLNLTRLGDEVRWLYLTLAWILLGYVALIFLLAPIGLIRLRVLRAKHARFADEHGFDYRERDDTAIGRWTLPPFEQVPGRRAAHVIRGEISGRPFVAFDYSSPQNSGQGIKVRRRLRVGVVPLGTTMPSLVVRPEGVVASIAPGLARLDADVENEDFNRRFRVEVGGTDVAGRRYAVDVLNPRTLEWLLSTEPFGWQIEGTDLVGWWPLGAGPERDLARVTTLVAVAEGIPSYWLRR